MGRFHFGQIVLARISDQAGRVKDRPALIISSNANNDAGEPLQLIAITKSLDNPCPDHHVVVHRGLNRDPKTGLDVTCVAKCNWIRDVEQSKVIRSLGYMHPHLLEVIADQFDRIISDQEFDDWV